MDLTLESLTNLNAEQLRELARDLIARIAQQSKLHVQVIAAKDSAEKATVEILARVLAALDLGDWDSLSDEIKPLIETILRDAGAEALVQIGITDSGITELVNDRAVKYAEQRAAELVTRISESTREMLRADIAEAIIHAAVETDLRAPVAAMK